jgi:3-hydroxybutyryl-CoA dehydrogenase
VSTVATPLPASAAVVGGGTMGAGIAVALALAGVPTTVLLRRPAAVPETDRRIAQRLETHRRLGLADREEAGAAAARIETRPDYRGGPYDVAIETVAEDLAAKREVLRRAEALLTEDGIVCSNTSSLPIGRLTSGLEDPSRLVGWHWFHPADLMELVEVVPGPRTRAVTLERVTAWSRALGKTPVQLDRDTPGFVANRLQYALLREAYSLVDAGVCSVADVDAAVTAGLGPRWSAVGPFASMDLAGLSVHAAVVRALFPALSQEHDVPGLLETTLRRGGSGADDGAGLCGAYAPEEAAALADRRDQALAARLRAARDRTA